MDCPFEVRVSRNKSRGGVNLKVYRPQHNHKASEDHRQHAKYRQPIEHEAQRIESLLKAGVPPRFILNELLEINPDTLIRTQEINNHKTKIRQEWLDGKTWIKVLVQELKDDDNWALQYYTAQDGKVTFLFFARDEMIEIAQASPSVMIMDATYRTNKLNMPTVLYEQLTEQET